MPDLNQTVVDGFTARYVKLSGVARELAGPLSDEEFWTKPFPFGNSFGHLVLHLTGNLSYTSAPRLRAPDTFGIVQWNSPRSRDLPSRL
jgi:hypothetical protein